MLFIRITSPTDKSVEGFECGTRDLFDKLHGGDPLWLFVDQPNAVHRSDLPSFLRSPRSHFIDDNGNIRPKPN